MIKVKENISIEITRMVCLILLLLINLFISFFFIYVYDLIKSHLKYCSRKIKKYFAR